MRKSSSIIGDYKCKLLENKLKVLHRRCIHICHPQKARENSTDIPEEAGRRIARRKQDLDREGFKVSTQRKIDPTIIIPHDVTRVSTVYNFPYFCMTCGLEKLGHVDQN